MDGECPFDDPVLRRVAETMWQQIPSHFEYIISDPARWHPDKYNAQASGPDPMAAEVWRLLGGEEQ